MFLRTLNKSVSLLIAFSAIALSAWCDKINELPVKTVGGHDYYSYEVKPKETVFSLTHRFGITTDELIRHNPSVRDGLKAYSTLLFPVEEYGDIKVRGTAKNKSESPNSGTHLKADASALSNSSSANSSQLKSSDTTPPVLADDLQSDDDIPPGYTRVKIQRGQSLFGIARLYDTDVEAILAANPEIDAAGYKSGQTILVPVGTNAGNPAIRIPVVPDVSESLSQKEDAPYLAQQETSPNEESESVIDEVPDTVSIVLMLPLDLKSDNLSRSALYATEFYKGFLLGLEQYSHSGLPVRVKVYDISIPDSEFRALLESEDILSADLFIGPDNEDRILQLGTTAKHTGASIINPFVIKDELFQSNPSIIQTNIPRNEMYSGAIDKFIELYPDAVPVFIARVDGEADKVAFVEQMKERLDEVDRSYIDIVFRGVLMPEDMMSLSSSNNYVFLPVTASRNEFSKFSGALKDFKVQTADEGGSVILLGYPEWTTFRGDQLEQMKTLNTTIYSRFRPVTGRQRDAIEKQYVRWYGDQWSDVEPNQALLGYDMARYAVNCLRNGGGEFIPAALQPFNGIQSAFNLARPTSQSGYVNEALYIVNYSPSGIETEIISVPVGPQLAR